MPLYLEEHSTDELIEMRKQWLEQGRHRAQMYRDIIKTLGAPHIERVATSRRTYLLEVQAPAWYPNPNALIRLWLCEYTESMDEVTRIDRWAVNIYIGSGHECYHVACLPYRDIVHKGDAGCIMETIPLDENYVGDKAHFIPGKWMDIFGSDSLIWKEYETQTKRTKEELEQHIREQLLASMLNGCII